MMRPRIDPSEEALVDRARSGDVDAFEALVRGVDDRMRALAYRMLGDRAAMDDALQDAYVKAFRSIGSFRADARFSTWLHRIVATTCLDHLRRRRRRAEEPLAADSVPLGGSPADPAGDSVTRRLDVVAALGRLDPDQRAALVLVDGEGLSYDAAGALIGVPAGTVSSRLTRARAAMRTMLEEGP